MRDISHYDGREQEFIKHTILETYLPELGFRVGRYYDEWVYIDGFAGPWQSKGEDHEDASFGVAARALKRVQNGLRDKWNRNVNCKCFFVEKDSAAFLQLDAYAKGINAPPAFQAKAYQGEFVKEVGRVTRYVKALKNSFKFIFLDPLGWADIPMADMRSLLALPNTEVVINLMTSHMARFLEQESRAASYTALFGRPGVLEKIRGSGVSAEARAEASVREYCISLRELCNFKYVSEAVILEPEEEKIRYFLIYATNHSKGISVFKDAERRASNLQTEIRNRKSMKGSAAEALVLGPLASKKESELAMRYTALATSKVLQELLRGGITARPVPYENLFCEAMAFGYVTPDDLQDWLVDMGGAIDIKYGGNASRRSKLSADKSDNVIVRDRATLEARLAKITAAIGSGQYLPLRSQGAQKKENQNSASQTHLDL